ncbi:iron complex outermembrane receptor protein [Chitinophaga skermanii]|uniref:Iron complex outermembrane receptor protein n=1 Tax=Chitinophaga skermanii TaxID=331697 RepID=A0A327R3K6_9BACT|nr:TonB-dependent receptor [Chitinophaga skermanii]RAJ10795.1 iron complex outermembrane receptor protein [Chitinophaga skermanii]
MEVLYHDDGYTSRILFMNMIQRVVSLLALCLLFVRTGYAQCTYTLSGKITDSQTNEALIGATIGVVETQQATATDERGFYKLNGLCAGTYTIRVMHIGCKTYQFSYTVAGDGKRNIQLEHAISELQGITVAGVSSQKSMSGPVSEVSGKTLEKVRGLSLAESLKDVNGVTMLSTGATVSKPIINGLHSNRVLIYNNGVRQEGQQWGTDHAPEVDPFIANKLVVIKGANAIRYGGDAVGGVILVEPKPLPTTPGISGELNLGAFSNNRMGVTSATVEGNFAKIPALSWRVQGTLRKGGTYRAPGYWLDNTGMEEKNFSLATGWRKEKYGLELFYSQFNTNIGVFTGSHIGNRKDLEETIKRDRPLPEFTHGFSYDINRPMQTAEHELFKAKAYLNTGKIGKINLDFSRQFNYRDELDRNSALSVNNLKLNLTTYTANLAWDHYNWHGLRGTIGATGTYQRNHYQSRMFIPNYESIAWGVFAAEKWESKNNQWMLEGAIRYDNKSYTDVHDNLHEKNFRDRDFAGLTGTLGATWYPNQRTTIAFNATNVYRVPGPNELYAYGIHHGTAMFEEGDRNLKAEQGIKMNLSGNYKISDNFEADVVVYYNRFQNFIFLQLTDSLQGSVRGFFPYAYYTQANVNMKGVDAQIRWHFLPKWQFSSKASILRARNEDINDWLISMPSDRFTQDLTFYPGDTKRLKDSYFSLTVSSVTKQTRVPFEANDKGENKLDLMAPPNAYTLVNLEAGTDWHLGKRPIGFILGASNLLNQKYREYLNTFRYFADDPGINVYLKVKVPFTITKK